MVSDNAVVVEARIPLL